jgi:hypothetical protein
MLSDVDLFRSVFLLLSDCLFHSLMAEHDNPPPTGRPRCLDPMCAQSLDVYKVTRDVTECHVIMNIKLWELIRQINKLI